MQREPRAHLFPDGLSIIKGDPLVARVGVGAHPALRVLHYRPAIVLDEVADLQTNQSSFLCFPGNIDSWQELGSKMSVITKLVATPTS